MMPETPMSQTLQNAFVESLFSTGLIQGLVITALLVIGCLLLRAFIIRIIRGKKDVLQKQQRRLINHTNNATTVSIIILIVFIWAPQLHGLALSLTALAVAIVITTKELLMCLTGGFLRASNGAFEIGDWITVEGVTGEVMKVSGTTTTLEVIDTKTGGFEFTGETVAIPNSKFLSHNVINQNFNKDYTYYNFVITVQFNDLDAAPLLKSLEKIVTTHYTPHAEKAHAFNKKVEKKSAIDFADPDPTISLSTSDLGHYRFAVSMFIPPRQAQQVQHAITNEFLSLIHKKRQAQLKKNSTA